MQKKITKLLLLFLLNGCEAKQSPQPVAELISHRGYNNNKLDGFVTAIQDGFSILETDIRLRNEEPVLLHDNIACSNCTTLVELLELAQDKGVVLFLEFKEFKAIEPSLKLISQYSVDVVLTSFNSEHLKYINSLSNHSLGFITTEHFSLEYLPVLDYVIINRLHIDKCPAFIKCVAWGVYNKKQFNQVKYKVDYAIIDKY